MRFSTRSSILTIKVNVSDLSMVFWTVIASVHTKTIPLYFIIPHISLKDMIWLNKTMQSEDRFCNRIFLEPTQNNFGFWVFNSHSFRWGAVISQLFAGLSHQSVEAVCQVWHRHPCRGQSQHHQNERGHFWSEGERWVGHPGLIIKGALISQMKRDAFWRFNGTWWLQTCMYVYT